MNIYTSMFLNIPEQLYSCNEIILEIYLDNILPIVYMYIMLGAEPICCLNFRFVYANE